MLKKLVIFSVLKSFQELPQSIVQTEPLPHQKKIVAISPHSDDISVACGGTISVLSRFNQIRPFLLFSGWRGVEAKSKIEAMALREKEMAKEAKILKMQKPVFLRLDSYDKKNQDVLKKDKQKLSIALKKAKPDIIFLPKKDDLHPRHKLATELVLAALDFPCILFFYENPWSAIGAFKFNSIFAFSSKEIKEQMKAIRAHRSQLKRTRFDKAAKALAQFRGAVVPEQRIFGYGNPAPRFKNVFIEAFEMQKYQP